MQFGLIILLIQVVLIVHAAKTGRFWPWGYVILFLLGFGALAYVLVELVPEWFGSVQGQHARKRVVSTLDPGKRYRLLTDQLEVTDTIANRSALAEECLALGKFDEALRHYEHILSLPLGDAAYALGKARAQFGLGHPQDTVATLDDLRARSPDYQRLTDTCFTPARSKTAAALRTRWPNIRRTPPIMPAPKRACPTDSCSTKPVGGQRRRRSSPRSWPSSSAPPNMSGGRRPSGLCSPKRRCGAEGLWIGGSWRDFPRSIWERGVKSSALPVKSNEPAITPELIAEHGLKPDEYARLEKLIGRKPSFTELGIFSAMWNEHCSYKSSKIHLRTLPTKAQWVIQGPGENAGVIDIGDGLAVVFKMESHNHPSYIEPYQGAATGVGGILRDVFTMGARPIACLNALSFGDPKHPKTRALVGGVVAGIGGYGNSFGVPTVGGEVRFHRRYDGNCLVNAMAVGLADADKIFYSAASGVGMPIVYLGSKTGRDGIHGASMASAEFGADAEEKRPTVQVGDPFSEKLLLEACLEIMAKGCVIAIQDMGAAGLTCSAVEMGAKGDLGVTLNLDKVPCREIGMSAYEMMLSESQERMLMVLKPEKEQEAEAIFRKWGLDFAVVGETTPTKRFIVRHGGAVMADLPIKELGDEAPVYDRPFAETEKRKIVQAADVVPPMPTATALEKLIGAPDLCSRRWVWEQYDHVIIGNTVQRPGGDAAVVRINDGPKALALTSDVTPRYCEADPFEGGMQAVAEAWRNLSAVGAKPLALTDNLNFGNPERPEIMGQLVGCIRGIGEAARALDFPIVSGNVSLYNETNGRAILPTPTIGGVGVLDDFTASMTLRFKAEGEAILLIGETRGWLGQSVYLREVCGREEGAPPPVDLAAEKRHGEFVRNLIRDGLVTAAHDVSDGGLLVALAEMAIASGIGAVLEGSSALAAHAFWFGEDQGRYVVTGKNADLIAERAKVTGVRLTRLGATGGKALAISGERPIAVAQLKKSFEGWLPAYMAGQAA